ncbi:putative glutamate receptor isoform X2 [Tubulanus polymorphus]
MGKKKPIIKVTTIVEEPFMKIRDHTQRGNDKYTGFLFELIREIASHPAVDADFEVKEVPDETYGEVGPDNRLTGMLGQLEQQEADVAAAIFVNSSQLVRDRLTMSTPYMESGIVMMVYRKPGSEEIPYKSFRDLKQRVLPGLIESSVTEKFFQNSKDAYVKQLYRKIVRTTRPFSPLFGTADEAVAVLEEEQGNATVFMEFNLADYWAGQQPCNKILIDTLKHETLVLPMQKLSPWKSKFDFVLKEMRRNGQLKKLVEKWWATKCSGNTFKTPARFPDASATTGNATSRSNSINTILAISSLILALFLLVSTSK